MSLKEVLKFVRLIKFLKEFNINISYPVFRQLVNGYDSNGRPSDFSKEQKVIILNALEKLANQILYFVKSEKEKI